MIAIETTEVRNLDATDRIEKSLCGGFPPDWDFDRDWIWVAIEDGRIVGSIMAAPCHKVVIVQVVNAVAGYGKVLRKLWRTFVEDCQARGFLAYMAYVNPEKPEQVKLLRIALKSKGVISGTTMVCFGGKLADVGKL